MTGLESFVALHPTLAYLILFGGMFIEGEVFFLTAALFVIEGHLRWDLLLVVTFLGTILGDIVWFMMGRYATDTRFGKWVGRRTKRYEGWIDSFFLAKYKWMAFFSKFLYYVNRVTPLIAGWRKMPFRRFVKIHLLAGALWVAVMGIIAYLLRFVVIAIGPHEVIRKLELAVIGFVVLFIGGEYLLKILFDRKLRRMEKKQS